ncbi:hypothetical protein COLO4_03064 [Corchorus olitorius]|uniref:Uncharacterized protein n=1 Tax=Corchorus olitorius TaxID=93759 RepID=A0A1R3KZM6_9ROSI|nr:hypothetical protein COLO4_03064 [Corchorus olitorius]
MAASPHLTPLTINSSLDASLLLKVGSGLYTIKCASPAGR